MTTSDDDLIVETKVAARALGVTRDRLNRWVREDGAPTVDRGRGRATTFSVRQLVAWYVERQSADLRSQLAVAESRSGGGNEDERRWKRARAELSELELARRRRKLVDAEAVTDAWSSALARVRAQLLALPAYMSSRLEGRKASEIEHLLDDRITRALVELTDELSDDGGNDDEYDLDDAQ